MHSASRRRLRLDQRHAHRLALPQERLARGDRLLGDALQALEVVLAEPVRIMPMLGLRVIDGPLVRHVGKEMIGQLDGVTLAVVLEFMTHMSILTYWLVRTYPSMRAVRREAARSAYCG